MPVYYKLDMLKIYYKLKIKLLKLFLIKFSILTEIA